MFGIVPIFPFSLAESNSPAAPLSVFEEYFIFLYILPAVHSAHFISPAQSQPTVVPSVCRFRKAIRAGEYLSGYCFALDEISEEVIGLPYVPHMYREFFLVFKYYF